MLNSFFSKFISSIVRFISSETRNPDEYNSVTINLSRVLIRMWKSELVSSHLIESNSCFISFWVKKLGFDLIFFGVVIESRK